MNDVLLDDVMLLWGGWEPLLRIVVVTVLGYVWLVFLVSRTGPRTLSTMSPFDFVITVTIGSAFGRVITAQEVAIPEVVVAFAVLIALQWGAAVARNRHLWLARALDATPVLLYHQGAPVREAMRRHRLDEDDLVGAALQNGLGSLESVEAIVLQPDGGFAVISTNQAGDGSAIPKPGGAAGNS
jgi:uncharacterized membrane protein YcaP (DUF421 family)